MAVLTLCVSGGKDAFPARRSAYSASDPFPNGRLRVTTPVIAWPIALAEGSTVTHVSLTINGTPTDAHYNVARQAVWYTPASPLKPGTYGVHCSVIVDGSDNAEKDWNFKVAPDAVEHLGSPSKIQTDECSAVNDLRRSVNLPLLTIDQRLCAAANGHSGYLAQNGVTSHDEFANRPGFIAEHFQDRAQVYGYAGACSEDLSQGYEAHVAIPLLFAAPYHRRAFLQPGVFEVGAGNSKDYVTLLFGKSTNAGVSVYPSDGQVGVPTGWNGIETPSPMDLHPEAGGTKSTGYVISLFRFGPDDPHLIVSSAVLTTSDGKVVPTYINEPMKDRNLQDGVLIIPQKKLMPGTTYHVSVQATDDAGDDCSKKWSFTTAS